MRPIPWFSIPIILVAASSQFAAAQAPPAPDKDDERVVTHHKITVDGKVLSYTATAGMMPIRDSKNEVEARMFYVAYALDNAGDAVKRPLMFSFNGGPGSSSVWLHMGALGPKRVSHARRGRFACTALPPGRQPANLARQD